MLEINGKKFLNEQEAICYLLNEVQTLKQSLGSALPDPIEGPAGPTGATGATGPQGERGTGVFGCSSVLPSATGYKDGDFYVLFNGDLYKKVTGNWVLQTNLKGPQGAPGLEGGTEVVANPVGSPTDNLEKINIDGTIYEVITTVDRNKLGLITYSGGNYILTTPILITSNSSIYGTIYNNGTIDSTGGGKYKLNFLSQIVNSSNNPIIICENFNDSHGNARFVEGNITFSPQTGVTFDYAKWSLSGSHLMIVVAGTAQINKFADLKNTNIPLPQYIKDKINVIGGDNITWSEVYVFNNSTWKVTKNNAILIKAGTDIQIFHSSDIGIVDSSSSFRVQFDLLIDME